MSTLYSIIKVHAIRYFIERLRNFNRSLDLKRMEKQGLIYNSRNFNRSLDLTDAVKGVAIYNSRNFNRSLDFYRKETK